MTGKQPKRPRDPNQLAKAIIDIATGNIEASPESGLTKRARQPRTANQRRPQAVPDCRRRGVGDEVDYAMLVKIYGADPQAEVRYSPAKCLGADKQPKIGNPDSKHISTS